MQRIPTLFKSSIHPLLLRISIFTGPIFVAALVVTGMCHKALYQTCTNSIFLTTTCSIGHLRTYARINIYSCYWLRAIKANSNMRMRQASELKSNNAHPKFYFILLSTSSWYCKDAAFSHHLDQLIQFLLKYPIKLFRAIYCLLPRIQTQVNLRPLWVAIHSDKVPWLSILFNYSQNHPTLVHASISGPQ